MTPLNAQNTIPLQSIRVAGASLDRHENGRNHGLLLAAPAILFILGRFIFPD
jgi:hypothetical protein